MKLKTNLLLAAVAAFSIGSANAAVVLLQDNFNDNPNNSAATFNDNLATTQVGSTLGVVNYNVDNNGQDYRAQHSNGSRMLLTDYASVSLDHDFSVEANTYNSPLTFEFGYLHARSDGWGSFVISAQTPDYIQDATVIFGQLFLGSGSTQMFKGATNPSPYASGTGFVNNAAIKFVLSNTAGTGSAFNSAGSVLTVFSDNSQINQFTLPQLGSGTFFSFGGGDLGTPNDPTTFDDLIISVVPEPSAAALAGLAGLGFALRRRRA